VRFLGSYARVNDAHGDLRIGTFDADFHAARAWVASLREGRAT
jgi:prephenate dehydratase